MIQTVREYEYEEWWDGEAMLTSFREIHPPIVQETHLTGDAMRARLKENFHYATEYQMATFGKVEFGHVWLPLFDGAIRFEPHVELVAGKKMHSMRLLVVTASEHKQ